MAVRNPSEYAGGGSGYPGAERSVHLWAQYYYNIAKPEILWDPEPSLDINGSARDSEKETQIGRIPGGPADIEIWKMHGVGHIPTGKAEQRSRAIVEWLLAHPKPNGLLP